MQQTAIHDWHVAHKGRMVDFAGWHMPIQYTSIVEEHKAVRTAAGLFDIAHMGRIWFSGPQHLALLDHLLTNHVNVLKPGQIRYSLVCREDGGILDDVLIYRFEDECLLVVNASNRLKILEWIKTHDAGFDAQWTDSTEDSFMMALQGPQAVALLNDHIEADLNGLSYYGAVRTSGFGVPILVSRTGYTGEDGVELIVANADALGVWTKVAALGDGNTVRPCGLGCRDTLRLEAAMPLYGHEMDETVDPLTAGLKFGVRLKKEEFIGLSALKTLADKDDRPQRVGLSLSGKRIARQGAQLFVDGQQVGEVTSGSFSPTLQAAIAMGYLPAQHAAEGTSVEVDIRGQREPASVVALPFYQRSK